MIQWLRGFWEAITLQNVLLGVLIFAGTFAINLALVSFILVKLPADYFQNPDTSSLWKGKSRLMRVLVVVGKNILGVLLVAIGVVLSLPGVPGQGVLTILLGIMLLDFPGRRRFERWLVSRPKVLHAVNGLRHRFGKTALVLE